MYQIKLKRIIGLAILSAAAFSASAQVNSVTNVSSASYSPFLAPNSIASAWGSGLSTTTVSANTTTNSGQTVALPTTLGPVTLQVKDSSGASSTPQLYLVSPGQINYVVSNGVNLGAGVVTVQTSTGSLTGTARISNVAPALYTADASG